MFCMSLSNGAFSLQDFSTNNANIGQVTITRMPPPGPSNPSGPPSSIVVTHSSFPNPLVINGSSSKDFKSILYGSGNKQYVAILTLDSFTGAITRTVTIVDFCSGGSTPGQNLIHTQTPISNGTDTPVLFTSPGTQDVILVYSPTGTANEFQNLAFHRSATGGVLIDGPGTLSNSSAAPSASVTATELVMNHPNTGGAANSTSTPRPAGLSTITDPPNFGEVVIGASDPALGTSTKVASIKNDGNDCLTITAIGNVAPFTVRPATLAQLPKTLQPGQSFDVDIDFTPTAVGSNIQQNLPVTLSPNNGASQIQCKGSARAAVAKIATSPNTLAFGTIPLPGSDTKTFTVTNNGDLDVTITINGPPGANDFGWVPIPAPGLMLAVGATTMPRQVTFTPLADGPSAPAFDVLGQTSAIVPVTIGDTREARLMTRAALSIGGLVNLVEHPAVSRNQSRWRLQVMADHTPEHIDRMVAIVVVARETIHQPETQGAWS